MPTEGKKEQRLRETSEGRRVKRGSGAAKDQRGQMNDNKIMREMREKEQGGSRKNP